MRKFLIFSLLVLGLTASNAKAQGVIPDILRRMDLNNKSLQSLKADVTMAKYDAGLGITDKPNIGTTSYLPAAGSRVRYIRIDWTKPVEEQIAVIGDSYELYRPRLKQVYVGKTTSAKNNASVGGALSFMNMSKAELSANYTIVFIAEAELSDGNRTWHLELTPKTATSYKKAEIWVDKDGMPRQAKITERNNDTTTVLLSNIKKNDTIHAGIFKLSYDKKKVKIVPA